jgi:hypothetical protein
MSVVKSTETRMVETEVYVLTLSKEEAVTLGAILCRIGGMSEGYRGGMEDLLNDLRDAMDDEDTDEFYNRGKHIIGNCLNRERAGYGAIYFDAVKD